MATIPYAVGQNTSDHKTGSPTCGISSGIITFNTAQIDDQLGRGDRVTISGEADVYLLDKTSTTVWSCVTVLGATPSDVTAGATVTSIAHEYTSISAAEAGAIDANHLNDTDLTAGGANVNLEFPCYNDSGPDTNFVGIGGYTTDATHFIKIFAPFNTATECNSRQRHTGTAGTGYRVVIAGGYGSRLFYVSDPYTIVEGIEIYNSTVADRRLCFNFATGSTDSMIISCIVHSATTGDDATVGLIDATNTDNNATFHVYNNIVYGHNGTTNVIGINGKYNYEPSTTWYIYNNTVDSVANAGGNYAIDVVNDTTNYVRNNIIQGSIDHGFRGSVAASSGNITEGDTSPDGVAWRDITLTFVDKGSDDYRLAATDLYALGRGTDLSSSGTPDTGSIGFSDDIEGDARTSGDWDVGADQAQYDTPINYSAGQNATDHKTSTPTCTILNGTMTFSTAQTATNLGVGDLVTYDTSKEVYLLAKTSTTVWTVRNKIGAIPDDETSAKTVNSIAHEYTSVSAAEAGATDSSHLNTADLTSGQYLLNFPCYYDSGADTTALTIDGYTASSSYFLTIFTPTDTTTECNQRQRHEGVWDDSKFKIALTSNTAAVIQPQDDYIKIYGLQIATTTYARDYSRGIYPTNADFNRYGYNLVKDGNTSGTYHAAIETNTTCDATLVFNNTIYDFTTGTGIIGKGVSDNNCFVDNNTVVNCLVGYFTDYQDTVLKNNAYLSQGLSSAVGYQSTTWGTGTDFNISDLNDDPNATFDGNITLTFKDAASDDFHLNASDTGAMGEAEDLSGSFTDDIDGDTRPTDDWDIGSDQFVAPPPTADSRDHAVMAGVGRGVYRGVG